MRATSRVQVENAWVKVTEWCFAPGAETGHHLHGHDYVVVPLTSGVSMNASGTIVGLGVPGLVAFSPGCPASGFGTGPFVMLVFGGQNQGP